VRDTGKIFKSIENIKEFPKNINFYTPIYPNADTGTGNIELSEEYKVSTERADRKTMTNIKKTLLVRNLLISAEN
jgi:hypothetical protein